MAGGLKEVRERISSVKSTQQITKAMKMVSAAKLKRASDAITEMRPYTLKLQEMLSNVMGSIGEDEQLPNLEFADHREVKKALVVLITSDRGLAGAFNANLVKQAKNAIEDTYAGVDIELMVIGKKGYDAFKYDSVDIDDQFIGLFSDVSFENVTRATEAIFNKFLAGSVDVVDVVFSEFKNAATQIYQADRFLPIRIDSSEKSSNERDSAEVNYLFEPSKEDLLKVLVPKILKTQFYRYILDNNASEHGARMMAMEQATENANDLLRDLKLSYNRARQAAITKEISEIVGGVAALEG